MPIDGFLNLLKPPGMTSHDLVAFVRSQVGVHRVGHLGTLDPAAAGVLPVSLGRATRLFRFAGGPDKSYRAEVAFGVTTDTLDSEGQPTAVADSSGVSENGLREMLAGFVGELELTVPAFSAAHIGGKRSHELARRGIVTRTRPRHVRVTALRLVSFSPGPRARALLDIVCSTGTYVRSLAAAWGETAGCGAHLAFLVRTGAGRFCLSEALTLEEFARACRAREGTRFLLPMDWPLAYLPAVELEMHRARSFVRGTGVLAEVGPAWPVRVYAPGQRFLGLGEVKQRGQLRPRVVLGAERGNCCE